MKRRILLSVVFALLVFVALTFSQINRQNITELELVRQSTQEKFLKSESGITRYQVFGQENSPTLVLIHSFNGFLESWEPNIDALVNAGYQVVVYDLFGRGLSDRPHLDYSLILFRNQLSTLLDAISSTNVHLIGSSFGGVIAADYAKHYPENVMSISLIGPAGWPSEAGRNWLLDVPFIGDLVFFYFGKNILKPKVEAYFHNLAEHYGMVEQWDVFASYPGFSRAALSTLRFSPVLDYSAGWQQLGALNKPTLFIWGKQDISFPYNNTEKIPALIPHAKIIGIEQAAHWVNIEQADQVNQALIDFLNDTIY